METACSPSCCRVMNGISTVQLGSIVEVRVTRSCRRRKSSSSIPRRSPASLAPPVIERAKGGIRFASVGAESWPIVSPTDSPNHSYRWVRGARFSAGGPLIVGSGAPCLRYVPKYLRSTGLVSETFSGSTRDTRHGIAFSRYPSRPTSCLARS